MFRYVHTNIIAKDAKKLIDFYKKSVSLQKHQRNT